MTSASTSPHPSPAPFWRRALFLEEPITRLLLQTIRLYQTLVAPALPPVCRFQPTCSHYAFTAIQRYGAWRGSWLAARRLARCQPFGGSGYDPVP